MSEHPMRPRLYQLVEQLMQQSEPKRAQKAPVVDPASPIVSVNGELASTVEEAMRLVNHDGKRS